MAGITQILYNHCLIISKLQVYRVFRSDYNTYVEAYSHVVFQWLIPSSSNISSVNMSNPQEILDAWGNYQVRMGFIEHLNVLISNTMLAKL